jgi:SAM-dependent methyltransferase
MATKLAAGEINDLDPYKFMAVIDKRVIHPGGRASTQTLLARAQITASDRVLDVGCGVATTAIEIARRHRAQVTAADISPLMVAGRPAYTRKMARLMPRMAKAAPYLGYIIIAGTKPA